MDNTHRFDHDRLDAYSLAREAARSVRKILPTIPSGHGELVDQLRRACLSVCLNTAEGAGTWLPKEKARFYRIARGSATECAAVMDHLVDQGLLTDAQIERTRQLYARIVATLTKLIISVETTTREPATGNGPVNASINPPRKR